MPSIERKTAKTNIRMMDDKNIDKLAAKKEDLILPAAFPSIGRLKG